jgi:hypothetical protein
MTTHTSHIALVKFHIYTSLMLLRYREMTFSRGQITAHLLWFLVRQKGNVAPVLNYVIKHYAMKTYRHGGIAPPFLTSALGEGKRSASPPGIFTPGG